MKVYTLFILAILSVQIAFSQSHSYIPLINTTKQWNVHQKEYWNGYPQDEYLDRENTVAERFRGDTLINDMHYAFLETCTNDSTFNNWQRTTFIFREDTANKRVYCYRYGNESLLFDFSLEEGDVLETGNSDAQIIDSVNNEFIGGMERKVLYSGGWCGDRTMIEGIGTYTGLQDAALGCLTGMGIYSSLMCYSENGEVVYQDGNVCYIEKEYFKSIVDTIKQWNLHQYDYRHCGGSLHYERTMAQRFRGDTVIDEKHYSILETCTNDSTFTNWKRTSMYFREDATNAKLYCYMYGNESLVSDFSLNIGDTLFSDFREDRVVDSIKRIEIPGLYPRVMYFSGYEGVSSLVEGIASFDSFNDIIYGVLTGKSVWSDLMCYYENGELFYKKGDYCFIYKDHTNGIGENGFAKVTLYPNPVKSTLNIEFNEPAGKGTFVLYSIDGKIIHQQIVNKRQQLVEIGRCAPGLYMAVVKSKGVVLHTERIVISKQ